MIPLNEINEKFGQLADSAAIEKTADALNKKGVKTLIAENANDAREKFFSIVPKGAEVMNMTSTTLTQMGLDKDIMDSGAFNPVRAILDAKDSRVSDMEKKRLGAAHAWTVGSIHALTMDGCIIAASATGSQIPSYAYGADNILFIVGAQKIVSDLQEGIKRLYEYCLPLENERALKAYGKGSGVNKIFIINNEVAAGRLNVIIVKQKLGF